MAHKKTVRTAAQKKALTNRLKRLEGQIRGLEKMIEDDVYCNDIVFLILLTKTREFNIGAILL